uniref:Uncharacterized protein n=1 Tax=Arundo donax TaxID=35708 RepID=A0A0A9DVD1_ARUDO
MGPHQVTRGNLDNSMYPKIVAPVSEGREYQVFPTSRRRVQAH